jgi:nitroreductase
MTDSKPPAPAPQDTGADDRALAELAIALIASRVSVAPKRLAAPGPTRAQLDELLSAAAAAPDHGTLTPWRFVEVGEAARADLAAVFEAALVDRDPSVGEIERGKAREKAFRAPLLLLAVARLGPDAPEVPAVDRLVSLGAALQNLLLAAHALGYGAMLTSGRSMASAVLHRAFGLGAQEQAVCFVSVGTPIRAAGARERPSPASLLSRWRPPERDA